MRSLSSNTNLLVMSFTASFFFSAAALRENTLMIAEVIYLLAATIAAIIATTIFLTTIHKKESWMRNGINIIGLDIALGLLILLTTNQPLCIQTGMCMQGLKPFAMLLSTVSLANLVIIVPSLGMGWLLQTEERVYD